MAPWNEWKGPAAAGRQPFMPRKALALVRAALRFARQAADDAGPLDLCADGSRRLRWQASD